MVDKGLPGGGLRRVAGIASTATTNFDVSMRSKPSILHSNTGWKMRAQPALESELSGHRGPRWTPMELGSSLGGPGRRRGPTVSQKSETNNLNA
jgi:hypothetical protein